MHWTYSITYISDFNIQLKPVCHYDDDDDDISSHVLFAFKL